jgi:hypothetical protein
LDEYCICGKKKLFYTFIIVKYWGMENRVIMNMKEYSMEK